jgi:hypothetical protein
LRLGCFEDFGELRDLTVDSREMTGRLSETSCWNFCLKLVVIGGGGGPSKRKCGFNGRYVIGSDGCSYAAMGYKKGTKFSVESM